MQSKELAPTGQKGETIADNCLQPVAEGSIVAHGTHIGNRHYKMCSRGIIRAACLGQLNRKLQCLVVVVVVGGHTF